MELQNLTGNIIDLYGFTPGPLQRSGAMTVIPLLSSDRDPLITPPARLNLSCLQKYGSIEVENREPGGIAILPLHLGCARNGILNYNLSQSTLLRAGEKKTFEDACHVREGENKAPMGQAQGSFILPLPLRYEALCLRGRRDPEKLWESIGSLNAQIDLPRRGSLEPLLSGKRAFLMRYLSRFELLTGQVGALFLLNDQPVGVEIAPSAVYFAEIWAALVCSCYGVACLRAERSGRHHEEAPEPFTATSLPELRSQLAQCRRAKQERIGQVLAGISPETYDITEEECCDAFALHTLISKNFAGQYVSRSEPVAILDSERAGLPSMLRRWFSRESKDAVAFHKKEVIYLSLFARPAYLASLSPS